MFSFYMYPKVAINHNILCIFYVCKFTPNIYWIQFSVIRRRALFPFNIDTLPHTIHKN